MSETPDEARAEPTVAERLARFMHDHADEHNLLGQPRLADFEPLAEVVLSEFFRVDVEASSIYAMPGVDRETMQPFGMVHWGPMAGRLDPDQLRAIGAAFIEIAEAADLDSILVRWLLRDPNADKQGAIRVLQAFREYRAELEAQA